MKLLNRNLLLGLVNSYVIDSPTTPNITYIWNIGSLLGVVLVLQIISGITLAFHYCGSITEAFNSIEHIHRNVWYGSMIRYMHSNGAALFFILVYVHIGKGLYYGSYNSPRIGLWNVGIIIYILMMAAAFLGYTLPYGSMSYWGGTVITSMFSAIPLIGHDITEFIWGGFSMSNATLTRFYALHFVLPFVILAMVIVHLMYLHNAGSSNPLGISTNIDKIPFHTYFIFKDALGFIILFIAYFVIISYYPNVLGHSDNYIPADPLVTPASIVPEFYFLAFYAILRAVPNKLAGVVLMLAAIVILAILPYKSSQTEEIWATISNNPNRSNNIISIRSNTFRPRAKIMFWIFVANFLLLTWLGGMHATTTTVLVSQICTVLYFAYFLF